MTFLGMKLKVTQNRRRNGWFCRMVPFPLCITGHRLFTNFHCMGKLHACAHCNYKLAYSVMTTIMIIMSVLAIILICQDNEKLINPLKTSLQYTQAGVYGKCTLSWRHQIHVVFNGLIIVICRPHDPTITAVLSVWPLDLEFSLLFTRSEEGCFMCIGYMALLYTGQVTSSLLWKTRQWWSCTSPKATTAGPGFEPGTSWRSWYIGVFTRLSRWEPGFESHHRRDTFVLQQGNLSTLLLSTQVYL